MLEKFRTAKESEIRELKKLRGHGRFPATYTGVRPSFGAALRQENGIPAVIAEYKRASPSRGLICDSVSVEDAAREYVAAGASALSILTEKNWFAGDLDFVDRAARAMGQNRLPILRKDFIFDPIQIDEAATVPASAVLLIVRMLPDAGLLRQMREHAASYGMESVVEVFDESDLKFARESGAELIQVNARDLDKLSVDRQACLNLINKFPPLAHEKWIAASGINEARDLRQSAEAGFDAVLVGTSLMLNGRPCENLRALLGHKPC